MLKIMTNKKCNYPVLIKDMGIYIPEGGKMFILDEDSDVELAAKSKDLKNLLTDDKFGKGSSSLILIRNERKIKQRNTAKNIKTLSKKQIDIPYFYKILLFFIFTSILINYILIGYILCLIG